mmetsp:Transcript_27906/g.43324  ORF Transcript_27906/g.43324 Transcript_27906/m.43324 type:complete len:416 (+) Transcript_27906:22-1269(+)
MRFRPATKPTGSAPKAAETASYEDLTRSKNSNRSSSLVPKLTKKQRKSTNNDEQQGRNYGERELAAHDQPTESTDEAVVKKSHRVSAYEFSYPNDIPTPDGSMLQVLYEGLSGITKSSSFASPHLPLEGVILSAVALLESDALKRKHAEAHAYLVKLQNIPSPDTIDNYNVAVDGTNDVIQNVELMRKFIKRAERAATKAVKRSRRERERSVTAKIQEDKHQLNEQRNKVKLLKAQAKELRRKKRVEERKQRIAELSKTHPKNIEAWREVMSLQTTLANLNKEERGWIKVSNELDEKESELAKLAAKNGARSRRRSSILPLVAVDEDASADFEPLPDVETLVRNAVQDITLSADRINQALRGVKQLLDESERVKKDLYDKYTTEFQFKEFNSNTDGAASNNPKDILRFLSQDANA